MSAPEFRLRSTVLGSPDPAGLADFYRQLLGWKLRDDEPDWIELWAPDGGAALAFQLEGGHVPPTWPGRPGDQQMQMHLDIEVDDLVAATAHATALGASLADEQPQDDVRVLLDPAGHPFCLFAPGD